MKKFFFSLLLVLCAGVAGYALYAYFVLTPGSTVAPAMKAEYATHRIRILTHVFFAVIALVTGPLQFIPVLRRHRSVHRKIGYLYFASVFIGGIAGLATAFIAHGGLTARVGFGTLALLWLFTAYRALVAVRQRNFPRHEAWALRNFALTCAAVTLRIYLGLFATLGFEFEAFYPVVSWLCWVPNLIFIEWILLPAKITGASTQSPVTP